MRQYTRREFLVGSAAAAGVTLSGCVSALESSGPGQDGDSNESEPTDDGSVETIPGPERAVSRFELGPRGTESLTFDLPEDPADQVLIWVHLQYIQSLDEPDWTRAETVSVTITDEDAGVAYESIDYILTPRQTRQFQVVHEGDLAGDTIRVDVTNEMDDDTDEFLVHVGADPF